MFQSFKKQIVFLVTCIGYLILISCEKKELPAPKYERGDIITTNVEMGNNYKHQVWFSLEQNKVIATNYKTDWDVAFESSVTGWHIILNGGKAMKAYKIAALNLSQVSDTTGLGINERADAASGNLDSTAIGDWQSDNKTYIINRGYDELGQEQGFYKLKILAVSATQFTFEYADVFGSQTFQGTVLKNDSYNYVYYSFSAHQQVSIEPLREEYDLCFSQYTHLFHEPFQYYLVTGVLSNTYKTRVAKIANKSFSDITLNDTLGRTFSLAKDAIGYEWKVFDLNTNLYTVDPSKCYIIQGSKGFYYKIHFIDFYNNLGIKGYPSFEFKKL